LRGTGEEGRPEICRTPLLRWYFDRYSSRRFRDPFRTTCSLLAGAKNDMVGVDPCQRRDISLKIMSQGQIVGTIEAQQAA